MLKPGSVLPSEMDARQFAAWCRQPLILNPYTVATLPNPAANQYALIMVTDESGGMVPAFSDSLNWRRVTDRAIVS